MEYKINSEDIENRYTTVYPTLTFEDYVPDDFVYAPDEGLVFHYSIKDPTGAYFPDLATATLVTDLIGYSIEVDGEYYWTYLAYRDTYDGDWPYLNNPDMDLVGKYSQVMMKGLYPQSWGSLWDFGIDGISRDIVTGEVTLIGHVRTNFTPYGVWFDGETGEYKKGLRDNGCLFWWEDDKIIVNGEIQEHVDKTDFDSIFYDKEGNYKENALDNHNFEITIPKEQSYDDILIEFVNERYYTDIMVPWMPGYIISSGLDQYEKIIIPSDQETFFDVNFNSSPEQTIKVPYEYFMGEPTKYEEFTFYKLFEDSYKYPTTTTDLMTLSYTNGFTFNPPTLENTFVTANLQINGFEFDDIKIKHRIEENKIIFYVDESMYYDQDEEMVVLGMSSDDINENGIVLPWDSNSNGTLTFSIELETHQHYTFNIEMKIGSDNALRGEGGKFEVEEILNNEK